MCIAVACEQDIIRIIAMFDRLPGNNVVVIGFPDGRYIHNFSIYISGTTHARTPWLSQRQKYCCAAPVVYWRVGARCTARGVFYFAEEMWVHGSLVVLYSPPKQR